MPNFSPQSERQRRVLDRRAFLATAASISAVQLAPSQRSATGAPASQLIEVVDTHLYLGHWPFGPAAANSPQETRAALQRHQVTQAWAGTFDGLLHKDVSGANARLTDACRRDDEILLPFGTVNPTLPDWQEDVRRCHERFRMPGLRLHPSYHGYTLDDARFAELAAAAAKRKLIVQIVVALDDHPRPYLRLPTTPLDLSPLADVANRLPELQLTLHAMPKAFDAGQIRKLAALPNVYVEAAALADLDAVSATRILLGSCWPLRTMDSAARRVPQAVDHGAAHRLLHNASRDN